MFHTAKLHWPIVAALGVLLLLVASLVGMSLRANADHFVYALDDPYIHMAMARNLARHGVWGVTQYEFSSSSSSLLWTLLLSGIYLAVESVYVPFVLNVVFSILLLLVADRFLRSMGHSAGRRLVILLGLVILTPLPPLILSGMEHTAQILVTLVYVFIAAEVISSEGISIRQRKFQAFLILSMIAPAIRYEALALVFVAGLLLGWRKSLATALVTVIAGVAPLVVYGLISVRNGSLFLPNSILLKGSFPSGGMVVFLHETYLKAVAAPHLLLIFAIAVCLWFYRYRTGRGFWKKEQLLLIFLLVTTILHLLFAGLGWFYRYEAYLVALGIVVNGSLIMQIKPVGPLKAWRAALFILAVGTLLLLTIRGSKAIAETTQATTNIYQQQYQMAAFLNSYYQGAAVAANDIGAINYLADIKCLDLWGLGSIEVTRAKLSKQYSTQKMAELAQIHRTRIALIYSDWFEKEGGVPPQWTKVAEWTTPNCVVCGNPTVSFYALEPDELTSLKNNLRSFATSLPAEVAQSGSF